MNIGGKIAMFWLTLLIWLVVFVNSICTLFNAIGVDGAVGDKIGSIAVALGACYFLFRGPNPGLFHGLSPWDYVD